MNKILTVIILLFAGMILTGCATVFKGYNDTVKIINAEDSLKIYSKDGVEIPIRVVMKESGYGRYKVKTIQLRSNQQHTLILKTLQTEKMITLYPELGFGWIFLDLLCGGIPSFYDAYTGSWNKFSDINASMNQR